MLLADRSAPASQRQHLNVAEDNGTKGLSLRELVLEMREDLKYLRDANSKRPTRTELYSTLTGIAAIATLVLLFTP